jgi:hypothetical protein
MRTIPMATTWTPAESPGVFPGVDTRLAAAHWTLAVHQMRPDTGHCQECQHACPCDDANEAANALATSGSLVAVTRRKRRFPFGTRSTGPGRTVLAR